MDVWHVTPAAWAGRVLGWEELAAQTCHRAAVALSLEFGTCCQLGWGLQFLLPTACCGHGPRGLLSLLWGELGRGTTGWQGLIVFCLVPVISGTQNSVPPLTEAPLKVSQPAGQSIPARAAGSLIEAGPR